MNCFEQIVGLKEVDNTLMCEYWLNDLAGITTDIAQHLQNTDNNNIVEFWGMIKKRAFLKLSSDFELEFNKYFSTYCRERADLQTILPQILCTYKNLFKFAWLDLLAFTMLMERRFSKNINFYVNTQIQDIDTLMNYHKANYESNFKNAMKSVQPPQDIDNITHKHPNNIGTINYILP
jgi:hypothetical protein